MDQLNPVILYYLLQYNNFFYKCYLLYPKLLLKNLNQKQINEIHSMNEEEKKNFINEYEKKIKKEEKDDYQIKLRYNCIIFILIMALAIILLYLFFIIINPDYGTKEKFKEIKQFDGKQLYLFREYHKIKYNDKFFNDFYLGFYKFSKFAYDKGNEKTFLGWNKINSGELSEDNYFYTFKDQSNKIVIITFPGTLFKIQLLDEFWGSNLKNFDENNKDILLCEYFGNRAIKLLNSVFNDELNSLMNQGYQFITTGHSLGGAMAQAFMYLAIIHKKITKNNLPMTITFSQPRVGNKYFVQFLEQNTILNLRFFKSNDIVTMIPFYNFGLDLIKYFFNFIDEKKLYYHTENYHEIRTTDNSIFIALYYLIIYALKVTIILIISGIIIIPLGLKLKELSTIISPIKKKMLSIIPLIILIFSFLFYRFDGKKIIKSYSLFSSFIFILFMMILSTLAGFIFHLFIFAIIFIIAEKCKIKEEPKKSTSHIEVDNKKLEEDSKNNPIIKYKYFWSKLSMGFGSSLAIFVKGLIDLKVNPHLTMEYFKEKNEKEIRKNNMNIEENGIDNLIKEMNINY